MKYKRVLLKLSGEALMGSAGHGIDPERIQQYAEEVHQMAKAGVEIALVIGGGNIFRGLQASEVGIERTAGDYMGMLATVINGIALQNAIEQQGSYTRLISAIDMERICEPYIRRRAVRHLEKGKASPLMLKSVMVEYYGAPTPLSQVASVTAADARQLLVKPWEQNVLGDIEKAIFAANLGYTPQSDGEVIRINIPALTEERRRDLAKQIKAEGENAKVSLRNTRKSSNDGIKKLNKDGLSDDLAKDAEESVQNLTNSYADKIDKYIAAKEKQVLSL
ncbi:UNVERIFIED_CONTAM: hypothetical protein GTU68_038822 [Idotea baltica]|nr:hypothetical protein [Idotea baltica]